MEFWVGLGMEVVWFKSPLSASSEEIKIGDKMAAVTVGQLSAQGNFWVRILPDPAERQVVMLQSISTAIRWVSCDPLGGCHVIPLCGCHVIPLGGCHVIPLCGCHVIPLCGCHVIPLSGCHVIPLCGCHVIPLCVR